MYVRVSCTIPVFDFETESLIVNFIFSLTSSQFHLQVSAGISFPLAGIFSRAFLSCLCSGDKFSHFLEVFLEMMNGCFDGYQIRVRSGSFRVLKI